MAKFSISLHTDGQLYKYHKTNYPNFIGISDGGTSGSTISYTAFGGISTGHTGLTPGEYVYCENTGVITQTQSSTTKIIGTALTANSIIVNMPPPDTTLEFASDAEAIAGTNTTKMISPYLNNLAQGFLGEVRQFCLSITGAITSANLNSAGWAICNGTTPTSQGITGATITTTPNLQQKFLRGASSTTTGGTGGAATDVVNHTHTFTTQASTNFTNGSLTDPYYANGNNMTNHTHSGTTDNQVITVDTIPPYYEVAYFIKVK
jgi:hypothetical protein